MPSSPACTFIESTSCLLNAGHRAELLQLVAHRPGCEARLSLDDLDLVLAELEPLGEVVGAVGAEPGVDVGEHGPGMELPVRLGASACVGGVGLSWATVGLLLETVGGRWSPLRARRSASAEDTWRSASSDWSITSGLESSSSTVSDFTAAPGRRWMRSTRPAVSAVIQRMCSGTRVPGPFTARSIARGGRCRSTRRSSPPTGRPA